MAQEFIIGLTEHRIFGNVFVPLMMEPNGSFYTIRKVVKSYDLKNNTLQLSADQIELVKLIEAYSDEALVRKFARKAESSSFFQNMNDDLFQNVISPYIDRHIIQCVEILMKRQTRVFQKQAKYANLYDEDQIVVNSQYSDYVFRFRRNESGTHYSLALSHEGQPLDLLHKTVRLVSNNPCCIVFRDRLYAFRNLPAKRLLPFFTNPEVSVAPAVEEKYFHTFVLNTIREFPVEASGFSIVTQEPVKKAVLVLESGENQDPAFKLRFSYDTNEVAPDSPSQTVVSIEYTAGNYLFRKFTRDANWEKQQIAQLKQAGLLETNGKFWPANTHQLPTQEKLYRLVNWLSDHKKELQQAGFRIRQSDTGKQYFTDTQALDIEVKTTQDWFDIYATVRFGDYHIPFLKLRHHIANGIREYVLPSGQIAILPEEWFSQYQELIPFGKADGNLLRFRKHHFQLLEKNVKGIDRSYFNRLTGLNGPHTEKPSLPKKLRAKLRAYQEDGFGWMYRLQQQRFGGCLADDMGLGKTLQTITLLLKSQKPVYPQIYEGLFAGLKVETPIQPASLVVMPTSLVHNWGNELRKFAPSLKVFKYVGTQRKKSSDFQNIIDQYDVILTTYGTVRNDIEMLGEHEFFYVILDESQNIKNAGSKTYQTISQLKSQHRLVLTGTPIENSLSDLWSQMNFLNKGLLGNQQYFKREFITPIEKRDDKNQQAKLQMLIRPFVLRRTKEEVAKDLPPLTEHIRFCEMPGSQKEVYEKEKSQIRNAILQTIETEGMEKSGFLVLQGLTRLRQLANHPSMIEGSESTESGKFDEIYNCLHDLVAENHKVLIFSSFVKHLDLLRRRIEHKGWKYSLLTGKTANRAEVINTFQNDPENRIFLISLKAGGVGLNLTSADYVFIIDPWWNPAAENQAINRAHRIGQDKKVIVYRFITEGTIEEKIQVLKARKSALAEKFINSNNPFKTITKEEILSLFS